jgi:hypothetical protein
LVLPKGFSDDFGDDKPGDDAYGAAKEIIMIFAGDCFAALAMISGRPRTKNLTHSLAKGMPFLRGIHEVAKFQSPQESPGLFIAHS